VNLIFFLTGLILGVKQIFFSANASEVGGDAALTGDPRSPLKGVFRPGKKFNGVTRSETQDRRRIYDPHAGKYIDILLTKV
jgi:hypothetical protein